MSGSDGRVMDGRGVRGTVVTDIEGAVRTGVCSLVGGEFGVVGNEFLTVGPRSDGL